MTDKNQYVRGFRERAEKYAEQCAGCGVKIEQRHITRLNAYAKNPAEYVARSNKTKYHIKPGTQLLKKYKGREFLVNVTAPDEFVFNGRTYKTLSAIAFEICGHKVSGYDFFGFMTKNKAKNMV